jgi:hypothetical protein
VFTKGPVVFSASEVHRYTAGAGAEAGAETGAGAGTGAGTGVVIVTAPR